jgi:hypothetical protein
MNKNKEEKVADNLLQDINTVISELEEAEMEKEASIPVSYTHLTLPTN